MSNSKKGGPMKKTVWYSVEHLQDIETEHGSGYVEELDRTVHEVEVLRTAGSLSQVAEGNSEYFSDYFEVKGVVQGAPSAVYWIRTSKLQEVEEVKPEQFRGTGKYPAGKNPSKAALQAAGVNVPWVSPTLGSWKAPACKWAKKQEKQQVRLVPPSGAATRFPDLDRDAAPPFEGRFAAERWETASPWFPKYSPVPLSPVSEYAEKQLNDREKSSAWDKSFEKYPQVSSQTPLSRSGFRSISKPDKSLDDWLHELRKDHEEAEFNQKRYRCEPLAPWWDAKDSVSELCKKLKVILKKEEEETESMLPFGSAIAESEALTLHKVGIGDGSRGGLWSLRSLTTKDNAGVFALDVRYEDGSIALRLDPEKCNPEKYRTHERGISPSLMMAGMFFAYVTWYKRAGMLRGLSIASCCIRLMNSAAYPALPSITVSQEGYTVSAPLTETLRTCIRPSKWDHKELKIAKKVSVQDYYPTMSESDRLVFFDREGEECSYLYHTPKKYTVVFLPGLEPSAWVPAREKESRAYTGRRDFEREFHEYGWIILKHPVEYRQHKWEGAIAEFENAKADGKIKDTADAKVKAFRKIAKKFFSDKDRKSLDKRVKLRSKFWRYLPNVKTKASLYKQGSSWTLIKALRPRNLTMSICPLGAIKASSQEKMLQQALEYCIKQGKSAFKDEQWEKWLKWQSRQFALQMSGVKYTLTDEEEKEAGIVEEEKEATKKAEKLAEEVLGWAPWDNPEEDEEEPEEEDGESLR
jgi:hypothetical protein